jgi:hypothetical protein
MIALAVMLAGLQLGDFSHDAELRHLQGLPGDVRVHIDRERNCNHWAGEEPYDADRRRQINSALRQLHCERLEREGRTLRRRYAHAPEILKALRDNRDIAS